MHLISQRPLREFWQEHADSEKPLRVWVKAVKTAAWKHFEGVKKAFGSADQYDKFTIFNIGGNKYRLISVIHYNTQKVYVRHILTHKEYDAGKWKND